MMDKLKSKSIRIGNSRSPVYVSENFSEFLNHWRHHLGTHIKRNVFLILDENVENEHTDLLSEIIDASIFNLHIKRLKGGEQSKTLQKASEIWDELSALNADRSWVIMSIGGGTLSDLAGFVASSYKRGLSVVFMPTSLMAMIDASVGGKNALNQGALKNQIGTYYFPKFVFVFPPFLKSLSFVEYKSGFAEMLKHALLSDKNVLWKKITCDPVYDLPDVSLLAAAIRVKVMIVQKDPQEKNKRLFLNFGHSIGHAIESYFNEINKPVSHGEAVAYGMQFALYLSSVQLQVSSVFVSSVNQKIRSLFPFPQSLKFEAFNKFLQHDKKVLHGKMRIILIRDFGHFSIKYMTASCLEKSYNDFLATLQA